MAQIKGRMPHLPPLFSVGDLPYRGSNDMFSTVRQFEAVWRSTIRHIDGMRTGPLDFPMPLRLSVDALRQYADGILLSLQAFQRRGGASGDLAGDVPNVRDLVDRFLAELLKTKRLWNAFVTGTNDVMFGEVHGLGDDTETVRTVIESSRPQTVPESLMLLAGGAVVIGLFCIFRK